MANPVIAFGFAIFNTNSSSPYSGRTTRYFIPSTDNNAYYIGDAVKSLAGADATGVPGVVKITNGTDTIRGVIVGVEVANVLFPGAVATFGFDPQSTSAQVSIPASKGRDYYVYVNDDPEQLFYMAGDSTGTNQVAANVNKCCSFTVAAPSTATNAVSASVINSSTIAAGNAALNLRLIGLAQFPNNAFGANAIWVVKINQHELMGNQVGI